MDESGDNTDEDSSSKHYSYENRSRSPNDLSKQSNLSSYSSSSSINSQKGKHIDSIHSTTIRQHSTISSQVRAMTEQSWQTSQKGLKNIVFFTLNLKENDKKSINDIQCFDIFRAASLVGRAT